MNTVLLRVKGLSKFFPIREGLFGRTVGYIKAVDGISFDVGVGEVVSLVGESGSGKTTLAKCILLLERPTFGTIEYEGQDITRFRGERLRNYRRQIQAVFQNPFLSLDPRMNVFGILSEPIKNVMKTSHKELVYRIQNLLEMVGLDRSFIDKYPHELSGGQAQRVAVARAISVEPKMVILDEPTSALDVSVQAQILNLLAELRDRFNLSYLLITHDLSVVKYISDKILVIFMGKIMEKGLTDEIFGNPLHPYTQTLFSSIPDLFSRGSRESIVLRGEHPSPANPPKGCRFHTRCPYAMEICRDKEPTEMKVTPTHSVYCWLYSTPGIQNQRPSADSSSA